MSRRILFFLCFLVVACGVVPCAAQRLDKYDYAQRYFIIDSLRLLKNGGRATIDEMIPQYRSRQDILLELQLAKWNSSGNNPKELDPRVDSLKQLIATAAHKNLAKQELQGIFQLAGIYWNNGYKDLAFGQYMEAYNRSRLFRENEYPGKLAIIFEIGKLHSFYEDHRHAVSFFRDALQLHDYTVNGLHATIMNSLATSYRKLAQYDSAMYWYQQALSIATRNHDEHWTGILQGNIGIVHYLRGNDQEAEPLLKKDILTSLAHADPGNAANSVIILADIYNRQGRTIDALVEALRARTLMKQVYPPDYRLSGRVYHTLSEINRKEHHFETALLYADSAKTAADSVQQIHNGKILAGVQLTLQQKISNEERRTFHSQQKFYRYIRNGLIIGIALLTIIALLAIGRIKMRHRYREAALKQQHLISENSRLHAEHEQAILQKELDEFTRHIHQKNRLIEQVEQELAQIKQQAADDSREQMQYGLISELRRATILTDEQWAEFTLLFNKVYGDFLVRLRSKLPGISPADIRFIALSKLQLNTREMAGMLGISTDAVRVSKYRLRKKLNLSDDESLDDVIANI